MKGINQTKVDMVKTAVAGTKGRFFTAKFLKADGSPRVMNCRIGVKKHLQGGDATYNGKDAEKGDVTIGVYEQHSEGYRCFKASRVTELVIDGNSVKFT